ncbi:MAG: hypothetical protein H7833_06290 [Magnetococcus sp. DMHC-1]
MNDKLRSNLILSGLLLPPTIAGFGWGWHGIPLAFGMAWGISLFFFLRTPGNAWWVFLIRSLLLAPPTRDHLLEQIEAMSNTARKDGILAMVSVPADFPPLVAAKNHCVDGMGSEFLQSVMERECEVVLGQVATVRDALTWIVAVWTLFLAFAAWQDGSHRDAWYGVNLFGILAGLVLLRGHLTWVARELSGLYQLVIDGMVGINRGVNPRILMETLQAGGNFSWVAEGERTLDISTWQVTPAQFQEKLEKYLAEEHLQVRCFDAELPDGGKFSDLENMGDLSLQVLLREVSEVELLTALKGSSAAVVRKVMTNFSPRTADSLLQQLRWQKLRSEQDVVEAQQVILQVARKLEADGVIVIMGTADRLHRTE